MKKFIFLIVNFLFFNLSYSQGIPTIYIDSKAIKFSSEISLPYWVPSNKTLQLGQDAVAASIIEFNVNGSELAFNQVLNITNSGTVPSGKVWKIEAIGIGNNSNYNSINSFSSSQVPSIFSSPAVFSSPGTYQWKVPPGITTICIEIWGGGGNGGSSNSSCGGGGGGGGGYGYECFNVTPGSQYSLVVGRWAQTSSFGTLITATGGADGQMSVSTNSIGQGGDGGTSSAGFYISGQNGLNYYVDYQANGGKGGNGGNGGTGAINSNSSGTNGIFPGGGGGGANPTYSSWSNGSGGSGANGQIKIYF